MVGALMAGRELGLKVEATELPEVPMVWIWPGEKKGAASGQGRRRAQPPHRGSGWRRGRAATPSRIWRHAVNGSVRLARLARMESMERSGVGMGRCEDKGVDMGGADGQPPLSYFSFYFFSHLTNKLS
jgi:hypothetical protein